MALCTSTLAPTMSVLPAKRPSFNRSILRTPCTLLSPPSFSSCAKNFLSSLRAVPQKYVYPDPVPEFAAAETQKFRAELFKKLSKEKETFEDDLAAVVTVCTEIFGEFLHKEYGGPGTLLVEPFTDMMVALKEKKLPGAPLAARTALLWAQNYVDQDWEIWNLKHPSDPL